jgi:hypothetical protein
MRGTQNAGRILRLFVEILRTQSEFPSTPRMEEIYEAYTLYVNFVGRP